MPLKPQDIKQEERQTDPRLKVIRLSVALVYDMFGIPTDVRLGAFNLEVLADMLQWPDDVVIMAQMPNDDYFNLLVHSERFAKWPGLEINARYKTDKAGEVRFVEFTQLAE